MEFATQMGKHRKKKISQDFTQGNRTLGKLGYKWEASRLLRAILYKQNTNCRDIKVTTILMAF